MQKEPEFSAEENIFFFHCDQTFPALPYPNLDYPSLV